MGIVFFSVSLKLMELVSRWGLFWHQNCFGRGQGAARAEANDKDGASQAKGGNHHACYFHSSFVSEVCCLLFSLLLDSKKRLSSCKS